MRFHAPGPKNECCAIAVTVPASFYLTRMEGVEIE